MTENNKTKQRTVRYLKQNSSSAHELEVNMTINDAELGKKERRVRVPWRQVAKYYEGDINTSVLELKSGEKIYTTLTFNDLIKRLNHASIRNHSLDLRDVTGIAAHQAKNGKHLHKIFNQEAENPKIEKDDMLVIMYAYANDSYTNGCKQIIVLKSDITKVNRNYIKLRKWAQYSDEWAMDNLSHGPYINIDGTELNKRLKEASTHKIKILDLSEITQPDNGVNIAIKPKASPEVKRMYTF